MATIKEQEDLIQMLKFTPCTYRISMWGYGGEVVMGSISRKMYDYFKHRRININDYAWGSYDDEENELNIPDELVPFEQGAWYECDDMGHSSGVERDSGTLLIEDNNGNTILERDLSTIDGTDIELACDQEAWICQVSPGSTVFVGRSNEKGTFFEGEIELTAPFDPTKLTLVYDDIDGSEIISSVMYDGEDIDNNGGSTNGKSSEFGFFLVKEGNTWESYRDESSIEYPLTDWFPKKIKPVREGLYTVKTAGKNSYTYQAKWNGTKWVNDWDNVEIKIKEWQGISVDPDTIVFYTEDPAEELEKIEIPKELTAFPGSGKAVEEVFDWSPLPEETTTDTDSANKPAAKWPF